MRMGAVHLTVADLGRSLAYYEQAIGLRVHEHEDGTARLGTGGEDLLVLTEQPGAQPAEGYSGLFHFALLLPARTDLGRWLKHAARDRIELTGMSDHRVSEALYLRDPDYHGIEIYADRPRETWEGKVGQTMTTLPLDTDDLVRGIDDEPFHGLPEQTTMGHVHFCVADIPSTVEFWQGLGFELMAELREQAAFLATNGYHHHVGANTWQSRGAPYAPEDRARLTGATILGASEDRELLDPSGIPLTLSSRS
jgi:catechol 2,3-dioxygenase